MGSSCQVGQVTAARPKPKKTEKLPEKSELRREALLDAAVGVFLRYGHKKTSMDDVARAAGLSRQGLYGHWTSKDALFKDAVTHVVDQSVGAAIAALAPVDEEGVEEDDAHVEGAVVAAFAALHGIHFTRPIATEHMTELLEAATAVGVDVVAAERPFRLALAKLLQSRRGMKPRQAAQVADVLDVASIGLKHTVPTLELFRSRMHLVVTVILGEPS